MLGKLKGDLICLALDGFVVVADSVHHLHGHVVHALSELLVHLNAVHLVQHCLQGSKSLSSHTCDTVLGADLDHVHVFWQASVWVLHGEIFALL